MKKSKEELLACLEANTVSKTNKNELVVKKPIDHDALTAEAEEDYEFARKNIKELITTSIDAVGLMHNLTIDSEHPRAGEVLGNLIKQSADMNNQLLQLQKQRQELVKEPESSNNTSTTNNSIFVGTTSELQKLLKQESSQKIVDAE